MVGTNPPGARYRLWGWVPSSTTSGSIGDMSIHDADLQAAVDATSVAHDTDADVDLVSYLREQLAERDIETADDAWLTRTVEGILADRNYLVDTEPDDYTPVRDR